MESSTHTSAFPSFYPLCFSHNPLEPLLLNLRLRRRNSSIRIRVVKPASILSVLELRRLSRADAYTGGIGAACRAAVGVGNTAACDELGAIAGTDRFSAGHVGGDLCSGESGD
jgi:hypothetical protein